MRILIVDDDPDIRFMVSEALSEKNHTVLTAADPIKALALLSIADIDALVLDVLMPGLTGFELLELLRGDAWTRQIPVLFLSALGESKDRIRGLLLGANDYLPKPFDPDEVVARVERMADSRTTPPGGSVGELVNNGLLEALQSLEQSGKNGVLMVSGRRKGAVRLKGGRLVSASFGLLTGVEAIYAMFGLEEGFYSFEPMLDREVRMQVPDPELDMPTLVLRLSKLRDDVVRYSSHLPPRHACLWVTASTDRENQLPRALPSGEVYERIDALPGVTLEELVTHEFLSPIKVELAVAVMMERAWISTDPPAN